MMIVPSFMMIVPSLMMIVPWQKRSVDLVGKEKSSVVFPQDTKQESNLGQNNEVKE